MEDRQAGADIQISMEANYIGGKLIKNLVDDSQFMAKPNWSGELAARVYQVMVRQAVREGRIASLTVPEPHGVSHRQSLELGPRSGKHSETLETAEQLHL